MQKIREGKKVDTVNRERSSLLNKKIWSIAIILIFIVIVFVIYGKRINLYGIISSKENVIQAESSSKGFSYKVYDNMDDNNIKILVTAKDQENGVKEVSYTKDDGEKFYMYGKDKTSISFDYIVKKGNSYSFEYVDNNGTVVTDTLNVTDSFVDFSSWVKTRQNTNQYNLFVYLENQDNRKATYKLDNMSNYAQCTNNGFQVNGNTLKDAGLLDTNKYCNVNFISEDTGGNKIKISTKFYIDYWVPTLAEKSIVGDFVNYDAGNWTTTSEALPTSQGTFGKYTAGTSKNLSKNNLYSKTSLSQTSIYSGGWRILKISGTQVTLVHAGTPAAYYHSATDGTGTLQSIANLNNFCQNNFVNITYAQSARSIETSDVDSITGRTGVAYWRANTYDTPTKVLFCVSSAGAIFSSNNNQQQNNCSMGVRPVVVLKNGVKTSGNKVYDAYGNECWELTY